MNVRAFFVQPAEMPVGPLAVTQVRWRPFTCQSHDCQDLNPCSLYKLSRPGSVYRHPAGFFMPAFWPFHGSNKVIAFVSFVFLQPDNLNQLCHSIWYIPALATAFCIASTPPAQALCFPLNQPYNRFEFQRVHQALAEHGELTCGEYKPTNSGGRRCLMKPPGSSNGV